MVIKQALVIRRDLKMSPGLLAAQAAHISAQFVFLSLATAKAKESSADHPLLN